MRRKIILLGGLFFLISLLFLGNSALAAEDPCLHDKDCTVPAPTLVVPENNSSVYADSLTITGLSWNETLVDVYVDGVFNGRAKLNLDDSGIGNFAYTTYLPLTPGTHTVYTVARNLNERERSVESGHISFAVLARPVQVEVEEVVIEEVVKEEQKEEVIEEQQEEVEETVEEQEEVVEETVAVSTDVEDPDISIAPEEEGEVSVSDGGQIEGGVWEQDETKVSELQKTVDRDEIINEFFSEDDGIVSEQRSLRERQNRQIGFAMLGVIVVISIVWFIISSKDEKEIKEKLVVKEDKKVEKQDEKVEDTMDDELDRLV
ncbi:MAG: hypothetical protein ACKKL6_03810 [Candidatus Komeilibacteria bacterium]